MSNIVKVNILPPPVPIVTRKGDSLIADAYAYYQWYRNDTLLPGEMGRGYYVTGPGSYKVIATNERGCMGASLPLDILMRQRDLVLKRISPNLPNTELYFQAKCDGNPVYNLDRANIHVQENGNDITDFSFECADTSARCPNSVALVFDGSGSMGANEMHFGSHCAHAFIDGMDGALDEASIIWFNETVHALAGFSPDKNTFTTPLIFCRPSAQRRYGTECTRV